MAIALVLGVFVSAEVLAQQAQQAAALANTTDTGPFRAFLNRAAHLFQTSRNAIFVIAAFFFVKFAWDAINEGKIDWKALLYLLAGLVLLSVAGFIVSYMASPQQQNQMQRDYGLDDKGNWGN